MKILIIEDELHTANDLIRSLTKISKNIEVTRHTYSVKETISYLKTFPKIDLIFSDIKLVDGNSFEIFNEIETSIPIVFCTAYDEYALDAFKTNGIDYILKPFSQDALKTAVEKYQKLTKAVLSHSSLQHTTEQFIENKPRSFQRLLVHQGDKIIPISIDDILLFLLK